MPSATKSRNAGPVARRTLQVKVSLRGARPAIWRRLLVASDTPLEAFHAILQDAMGWSHCHLHSFEGRGVMYMADEPEFAGTLLEFEDERDASVGDLLRDPKDTMTYEYDFGDSWEHDIVLEKVLPPEASAVVPTVLAGARACPPEDVGGLPGYARFLRVMSDASHREHASMVEWHGGDFDPRRFDLDATNLRLRLLAPPRRRSRRTR